MKLLLFRSLWGLPGRWEGALADLSGICDWQAGREAGIFAEKFGPKRP